MLVLSRATTLLDLIFRVIKQKPGISAWEEGAHNQLPLPRLALEMPSSGTSEGHLQVHTISTYREVRSLRHNFLKCSHAYSVATIGRTRGYQTFLETVRYNASEGQLSEGQELPVVEAAHTHSVTINTGQQPHLDCPFGDRRGRVKSPRYSGYLHKLDRCSFFKHIIKLCMAKY